MKYHLGASSDREFDGNSVHVSLTDNPSHLEAVNPVVLGQARAKQFFHKDKARNRVIPILIHGDADEVVPISSMHDAEKVLKKIKVNFSTHISKNIGHGIASDGLAKALEFIKNIFS